MQASLNVSLAEGVHSLTASFAGDMYNAPSTSAPFLQTVGPKVGTLTTLTSDFNPSIAGNKINLTAMVAAPVLGLAGGTVKFWDSTTLLGTSTLNAWPGFLVFGAQLAVNLPPGAHNLRAEYVESSMFLGSSSNPLVQTVNGATTTTTLTTSNTTPVAGTPVSLSASVTGVLPGGAATTPSGTVTFSDSLDGTIGTAAIVAGKATLNYTYNTAGAHSVTASYGGDALNATSVSMPVAETVTIATSTMVIAANQSPPGKAFTLTATVSGALPAGTVTFMSGTTVLGTATVAAGKATLQYTFAGAGPYSLSASYSGDANNTACVSPTITVTPSTAQTYYIHTDQLDTPRQITDTAGNIVWQWDNSDPFGNNVPNENPSGQGTFKFDLRFPGMVSDVETGLFQNYFRDYDPGTGRYPESDPIGLAAGSFSTYTYAEGNPLSLTDPTGLDPSVIIIEHGKVGQTGKNDASVIVIGGANGMISPTYPGSSLPGKPDKCATISSGIYDYTAENSAKFQNTILRIPGNVPVVGGVNPNPDSDSAKGNAPKGTANGVLNHPTNNNSDNGNGLCGCTGVKNSSYKDYISNFKKGDKGNIIIIRIPSFSF